MKVVVLRSDSCYILLVPDIPVVHHAPVALIDGEFFSEIQIPVLFLLGGEGRASVRSVYVNCVSKLSRYWTATLALSGPELFI